MAKRAKVLFCATKDVHYKVFHLPYFKWFKENGLDVHTVASDQLIMPYVDQKFIIPIQRSPFHYLNFKAYKQLKEIINKNEYDIIHCHTPMGGVITRLAARKARKSGTKVIYTAHGFHFCKGAPLVNWMIYYPIEKLLSRLTDCLITINSEDYELAIRKKFKTGLIKRVHGVGVNTDHFKPINEQQKMKLRKQYDFQENDFIMIYVAEFNKNKNQQLLLHALALIKDEMPNCKLLLVGDGPLLNTCQEKARELNISDIVSFLGYRTDIKELLQLSDLAVASSLREGLPVNILEAMACGLPVIANDNRGHRELVFNEYNGMSIPKNGDLLLAQYIHEMMLDLKNRSKFGENSLTIIKEKYSVKKTMKEMSEIYKLYMDEEVEKRWGTY